MASSSSLLLYLSFFFFISFTSSSSTITISLTTTTLHHHAAAAETATTYHHHLSQLASLSLSRAHHLKSPTTTHISDPLFSRSYGGYSLSLRFGTPPQTTSFVFDTGSSLVWFPCTSRYLCSRCNFPNTDPSKIPVFIPKLSSSSKLIGCSNPKCSLLFGSSVASRCRGGNQTCPPYVVQYGLGSTAGLLLSETLVFPDRVVPDFLVGCSIFSTRQPEGIAGFGRSPESLPSQMGLKKFSYCLVSRRFDDTPVSSDLVLDTGSGSGNAESGGGLKYTRFGKNPNASNSAFQDYYYLPLRNVIVGEKKVKVPYKYLVPDAGGAGGTIVDSGSTFTFMEKPVFELVAKEFEAQMGNFTVAKEAQNLTGLRPCFNISGVGGSAAAVVPDLIFRFKGGAKMALPVSNYLAFVVDDVVCLTIMTDNSAGTRVHSGPAIILGNFQQQNFYIEYDLQHNRFGFRQQSCV